MPRSRRSTPTIWCGWWWEIAPRSRRGSANSAWEGGRSVTPTGIRYRDPFQRRGAVTSAEFNATDEPVVEGNGKARGCDLDAETPRRGDQRGEAAKSRERTPPFPLPSDERGDSGGWGPSVRSGRGFREKTKNRVDGARWTRSIGWVHAEEAAALQAHRSCDGGGRYRNGLVAAWVPARGWIRWRHCGGSKGGGRRMPPRMGSSQPKRLRY